MGNIKNDYALDMSKLVNQLRVKAGVMEMGERIAWGSDTALMREAADKIDELEALCLGMASQNDNRTKLANELERYNKWRRGAEDIEQPNPTELGILLDEIVKELRK